MARARVRRGAALGALLVAAAGVRGEDLPPPPDLPPGAPVIPPSRAQAGQPGSWLGGEGGGLAPPARGSRLTRPGGAAPQGRSRTIAFTTTG